MQGILRVLLPLLLLCALPGTARAECATQVSTARIVELLEQAEWAYGAADLPGFSRATEDLRRELPCLGEEAPRHLAARVHRAVGLRGFVERDPDTSTRAFAAARALEPGYAFPASLVPPGNPVLADYGAIPVESGRVETLLAPADGHLTLDGRPGLSRPRSWPALVQIVADSGEVIETLYLWPDEPMPPYEVARAVPGPAPTAPVPPPDDSGHRGAVVGLAAGAGGVAVASGALWVASRAVYGRYYDPATPIADLEDLRQRHNALVWAARGGAAGAVLLGASVALVARW